MSWNMSEFMCVPAALQGVLQEIMKGCLPARPGVDGTVLDVQVRKVR